MKFTLLVQVELPFMLNLSSRTFAVALGTGGTMDVDVDNEAYVVRFENPSSPSSSGFLIGGLPDLATKFGVDAARLPATKLKTVLRHRVEREVAEADLPLLDASELPTCIQSQILRSRLDLSQEELREAADHELRNMTAEDKAAFVLRERQRRFAMRELNAIQDDFLVSVNRLVRWYSVDASDFFVEEVGLHQLAATTTRGILRTSIVDDVLLETIPVVGKVPPLMTRAWLRHPPTVVTALEAHLKSPDDPDFARVLVVRSRHLLERTALRNAVAEAAASLEVAVARAIRKAMVSKGQSTAQVDAELSKTKMNFPGRAEGTLRTWCGKGVVELDASLWVQLKDDRTNFRNQVVHSDREPSTHEAHDVVERFITMTELVLANC